MSIFIRFWAIAALAFFAPTVCQAQQVDAAPETSRRAADDAWRLNLGVNYSTGDYDSLIADTEVISVPVALRYRSGGFSLKVSVPYVHVTGPGSLLDTPQGGDSGEGDEDGDEGDGAELDSSAATTMLSRSGLGDVALTASYSFSLGDHFYLDTTGRIKLPTASQVKRLGSGEVDYSGGLELGYDDGTMGYYISGRRRFIGNSPASARRDVWGLATGFSATIAPWLRLGGDYGLAQSTRATGGTISEITGWASTRLSRAVRLQVYAATGLTSASANFASGASLSLRF